jgi:hypothetical protein
VCGWASTRKHRIPFWERNGKIIIARLLSSEPWSLAEPSLLRGRSRQRHLNSSVNTRHFKTKAFRSAVEKVVPHPAPLKGQAHPKDIGKVSQPADSLLV